MQANDDSFIKTNNYWEWVNLDNYIFQDSVKGPLAWVGRVAPEKGLEDAVYVADQLGEKLKVWGFIEDKMYASKIENHSLKEL